MPSCTDEEPSKQGWAAAFNPSGIIVPPKIHRNKIGAGDPLVRMSVVFDHSDARMLGGLPRSRAEGGGGPKRREAVKKRDSKYTGCVSSESPELKLWQKGASPLPSRVQGQLGPS